MKLLKRTSRYAIFDDVLNAKDVEALWDYVQLDEYVSVHQQHWEKVWRLLDGRPLAGVPARAEVPAGCAPGAEGGKPAAVRSYPTRLPIDALFGRLLSMADEIADLVGKAGSDYNAISGRSFLYPAGSALSWHTDIGPYTGAFTYYAHRRWNATWGGELMLADESTANRNLGEKQSTALVVDGERVVGMRQVLSPAALDHDVENEVLCESGRGDFVTAKPNRLVVLSSGTPHRVARVDHAAGENVRCSISGFFLAARPRAQHVL